VIRGRFFLVTYFALLLVGLAQWGTPWGSSLAGLAFSVHVSSILDILIRQGTVRFPRMMATALVVSLVLGLFIYAPAGFALAHMAAPVDYGVDAEPFHRFDVVLVNQWAYGLTAPRRGEVVAIRPSNPSRVNLGYRFGHAQEVVLENELIDRLVGLPGDHVVWDSGVLSINGTPVSWKPLEPGRLPSHLDLTVPAEHYLILPSTSLAAVRSGGAETFWRYAGLFTAGEILGRAYLRVSPLSRFWFIR
jgi:signal peptidase I